MRPLTPTHDPLRPLAQPFLIGVSATVIIPRTKKKKRARGNLGGAGGGGGGSMTAEISIQAARVEISHSTEHFTQRF